MYLQDIWWNLLYGDTSVKVSLTYTDISLNILPNGGNCYINKSSDIVFKELFK